MTNLSILLTVCAMMGVSPCPEMPKIVVKPVNYAGGIQAIYSYGTVIWYQDAPDSIKAHEMCHHVQRLKGQDCTGENWRFCEDECHAMQTMWGG